MEKEKNENIENKINEDNNNTEEQDNNNADAGENIVNYIYRKFVAPYNDEPIEYSLDIQPIQNSFRYASY